MYINPEHPDISFWQDKPNFDVMRKRTNYVVLRSSQRNWKDIEFERNRAEAIRVGMGWGIYHFFDGRSSPKVQVDTVVSLLAGHPKPTEIWMDWERSYLGPYEGVMNVVACMGLLESRLGMQVGLYTGYWWFMANTNENMHPNQLKYLGERPLWLAAYTDDHTPKNKHLVKIPRPWKRMDLWQYGTPSIAHLYGVTGSKEIDMNLRDGYSPEIPFPQPAYLTRLQITIRS